MTDAEMQEEVAALPRAEIQAEIGLLDREIKEHTQARDQLDFALCQCKLRRDRLAERMSPGCLPDGVAEIEVTHWEAEDRA
ncbi:hypothetical protein [Thiomonas sp.]